jgi:hypothetical protein
MRTILFEGVDNMLNIFGLASNMRVSYLLSKQVVLTGYSASVYQLQMASEHATITTKLKILCTVPEYADLAKRSRTLLTSANQKNKHPNRQLIVAQKKFVDNIHVVFADYMNWLTGNLVIAGYLPLEEIVNEPFNVFVIPESLNGMEPGAWTDWLLLQREDEEDEQMRDMVVLPGEFFDEPGIRDSIVSSTDTRALQSTTIFLEPLYSMPYLNGLNIGQLSGIRAQTSGAAVTFQQAMNDWINLFCDDAGESQLVDHYNQQISTAMKGLATAFDNNDVLQYCRKSSSPQQATQVMVGAVPVDTIFQFYKNKRIVNNADWEKLQQAVAEDERLRKRWPVITMRCENNFTAAQHTGEALPPALKTLEF